MGIRHNDRDDFNNEGEDFNNEGEEYEGEEYEAHECCGDVSRDELDLDDDEGGGDPRPLGGGFSFSSTDWSGWED